MTADRSDAPRQLQQLLDRAATDPVLLERLGKDPLGTVRAEGVQINTRHLKHLMGMPDATDAELIEVLRSRMSHAETVCIHTG